jgi:hypothetical protein
MQECAQCHGKLGLGVRSRNVWNGRGFTFASVRRIAKLFMNWRDTTLVASDVGARSLGSV